MMAPDLQVYSARVRLADGHLTSKCEETIMNMLSMLALKLQMILNREEGQDLIEYALLVGLISLAAVAAIGPIGSDLTKIYTAIQTQLAAANV